MRLSRLLILLLVMMLPCIALADTTITLTFTGDVTLGGEAWLEPEPDSFASLYEKNGPEYFLGNFAEFFAGTEGVAFTGYFHVHHFTELILSVVAHANDDFVTLDAGPDVFVGVFEFSRQIDFSSSLGHENISLGMQSGAPRR